jgi:REP element-mobilizing transposase RayT
MNSYLNRLMVEHLSSLMPEASYVCSIARRGKIFDPGRGRSFGDIPCCYKHANPPGLTNERKLKPNHMADTFSQIYIQVVFAVQNRNALISPKWEEELYKYITGITQNKGQKVLAINGTTNHIHFFMGMRPTCCLSDLVREIKKSSNTFIKEKRFANYNFKWQDGFGAFSYGHSQLNDVIQCIGRQKEHHRKKTFKEEYLAFLKAFEIEFKDEYLFEWIDD